MISVLYNWGMNKKPLMMAAAEGDFFKSVRLSSR
jgi:hypothetical protein